MSSVPAPNAEPEQARAHERIEAPLGEALAAALIALQSVSLGRTPERTGLQCAIEAALKAHSAWIARARCAPLSGAGLPGEEPAPERDARHAVIAALEAIAAIWQRREPDHTQVRQAVELALAFDVLEADEMDCPLIRAAAGDAFVRAARRSAHERTERPDAARRPPRPWLAEHESADIEAFIGERAPAPRPHRPADGWPVLPCDGAGAIAVATTWIDTCDQRAMAQSDTAGPRNARSDDGAGRRGRGPGEDLYTRQARLERLRQRLEDARSALEDGNAALAWLITLAVARRLARAEAPPQ